MEDEPSVPLDGKGLSNLRVVDLKQELDKRGLSKSGSKKDLVKRLKQQLDFEKLCEERKASGDSDTKIKLDAAIEQNEFVKQYLALQQKRMEEKRLVEEASHRVGGEQSGESCERQMIIAETVVSQADDKNTNKCNKIKLILRTKGSDKSVCEIAKESKPVDSFSSDSKDKTDTIPHHNAPLVFARKSKVPDLSVKLSEHASITEEKPKVPHKDFKRRIRLHKEPKSPPNISESVTKSETDDGSSSETCEETKDKESLIKSDNLKLRIQTEQVSKRFVGSHNCSTEVPRDCDGSQLSKNVESIPKSSTSSVLCENITKETAEVNFGISQGKIKNDPNISFGVSLNTIGLKEDLEKPTTVFEDKKPKKDHKRHTNHVRNNSEISFSVSQSLSEGPQPPPDIYESKSLSDGKNSSEVSEKQEESNEKLKPDEFKNRFKTECDSERTFQIDCHESLIEMNSDKDNNNLAKSVQSTEQGPKSPALHKNNKENEKTSKIGSRFSKDETENDHEMSHSMSKTIPDLMEDLEESVTVFEKKQPKRDPKSHVDCAESIASKQEDTQGGLIVFKQDIEFLETENPIEGSVSEPIAPVNISVCETQSRESSESKVMESHVNIRDYAADSYKVSESNIYVEISSTVDVVKDISCSELKLESPTYAAVVKPSSKPCAKRLVGCENEAAVAQNEKINVQILEQLPEMPKSPVDDSENLHNLTVVDFKPVDYISTFHSVTYEENEQVNTSLIQSSNVQPETFNLMESPISLISPDENRIRNPNITSLSVSEMNLPIADNAGKDNSEWESRQSTSGHEGTTIGQPQNTLSEVSVENLTNIQSSTVSSVHNEEMSLPRNVYEGPKTPSHVLESKLKSDGENSEATKLEESTEKSRPDDFEVRLKSEYDSERFVDHYESLTEVNSSKDVTINVERTEQGPKSPVLHENITKSEETPKMDCGISVGKTKNDPKKSFSVFQKISGSKEDLEKPVTVFEKEQAKRGPKSSIDCTQHVAPQEDILCGFNVLKHDIELPESTESPIEDSASESIASVNISFNETRSILSPEKSDEFSESNVTVIVSDHATDSYIVSKSNIYEESCNPVEFLKNASCSEQKTESPTYVAEGESSSKTCTESLVSSESETPVVNKKIHVEILEHSPEMCKSPFENSGDVQNLTSEEDFKHVDHNNIFHVVTYEGSEQINVSPPAETSGMQVGTNSSMESPASLKSPNENKTLNSNIAISSESETNNISMADNAGKDYSKWESLKCTSNQEGTSIVETKSAFTEASEKPQKSIPPPTASPAEISDHGSKSYKVSESSTSEEISNAVDVVKDTPSELESESSIYFAEDKLSSKPNEKNICIHHSKDSSPNVSSAESPDRGPDSYKVPEPNTSVVIGCPFDVVKDTASSELKSDSPTHVAEDKLSSKFSAKKPIISDNETSVVHTKKIHIHRSKHSSPNVSSAEISDHGPDSYKVHEPNISEEISCLVDLVKDIPSSELKSDNPTYIAKDKLSSKSSTRKLVESDKEAPGVHTKEIHIHSSKHSSSTLLSAEISDHSPDSYKVPEPNTSEKISCPVLVKDIPSSELKSDNLTYIAKDKLSSKPNTRKLVESDKEATVMQTKKIRIDRSKYSSLTQVSNELSEASSSTEFPTSLKSLDQKSSKKDYSGWKNRHSSCKVEVSETVGHQNVGIKTSKEHPEITASTSVSSAENVEPRFPSSFVSSAKPVDVESEESLHEAPYISRKVSLSHRKSSRLLSDEPKQKKSKWGSFASKTVSQAISISTDSLKNWFPEFKLTGESATVTTAEMEFEDHMLVSEDQPLPAHVNNGNAQGPKIASTSYVEAVAEVSVFQEPDVEEVSEKTTASKMIFIQNLVRPFTLNQLKTLLRHSGNIVEESFWIDKIKSKCFVTYETEKEAMAAKNALHNTRWPASNPKILSVKFSNMEELELHKKGNRHPLKPAPETIKESAEANKLKDYPMAEKQKEYEHHREHKRQKPELSACEWDKGKILQESSERETLQKEEKKSSEKKEKKDSKKRDNEDSSARLLDDLFRKTKSTPCIYWLPLTEEEVQQKEAKKMRKLEREKHMQQVKEQEAERHNRRARSHHKSREKETRKSSTHSRSRSPGARRR